MRLWRTERDRKDHNLLCLANSDNECDRIQNLMVVTLKTLATTKQRS